MKAQSSAVVFSVKDTESALAFYVQILGFSLFFRFGDYAGVKLGDVELHLAGEKVPVRQPVGMGSVYIFCDEVDEYFSRITAAGAEVIDAPADRDYEMRDFFLKDPDGNVLSFGKLLG